MNGMQMCCYTCLSRACRKRSFVRDSYTFANLRLYLSYLCQNQQRKQ